MQVTVRNEVVKVAVGLIPSAGNASWGGITGDIYQQADLIALINSGITGGLQWVQIQSSQSAQAGFGYFVNANSLCSIALPASSTVGSRFIVRREGSANWRITQGVGQQILAGDLATTTGVTGRVESLELGCTIELVCKVANQVWTVINSYGNFDMV